MRIEQDVKLDFKDVLIRPKRSTLSSRADVDLTRTFTFKHSKQTWTGIPIIVSNMDTTGTFEMAKAVSQHKCLTAIHKYYSVEEWEQFHAEVTEAEHTDIYEYIILSMGISDEDFQKAIEITNKIPNIKFICIDVANFYIQSFVEKLKNIRKQFPNKILIAGNVVTGEMVEELILCGADACKIGTGNGSVCTTRIKSGVGYPQLSAIIETADSAHGLSAQIIGDGGCSTPGDIAKAFCGGADFVMIGGMFAGHDECGGKIIEGENEKKYMEFYGMSSERAMNLHSNGMADYRSAEGKCVKVEYKGSVNNTILDILGGLRSTMTYVGASKLKELSKRTTFIRVTQQTSTMFS